MENKKLVIIIFGFPGSGKGTQAEHIVEKFNLHHFNSGEIIERTVHDPMLQEDPVIQRERELFDSGVLNTPEWVLSLFMQEIRRLAESGSGIVFSGSPRTLIEAKQEIPLLEELYGSDRIGVIKIKVRPETSIFRNTHRRICKTCGTPLLYSEETKNQTTCKCGGPIVTRTLDTEEAINVRLDQYRERTEPIFAYIEERSLHIIEVDGEPSPDLVAKKIDSALQEKFDS